jgi:hypothetical protein
MDKRYLSLIFVLMLGFLMLSGAAFGELSVGVKAGDWIEYQVTTTGNPPEPHNVQWARMEIMDVQKPKIQVNVTTQANNGTLSSLIMTLNLEKGEIGAWFIIPSNLNVGDTFYDINLGRNVTIEGQEQKTYAGAIRTVTNATTPERIKQWDKATGVFVKSIDTLPGYTINATATKTNMWNPQILGLDETMFYTIIEVFVVVAIIAIVLLIVVHRKTSRTHS